MSPQFSVLLILLLGPIHANAEYLITKSISKQEDSLDGETPEQTITFNEIPTKKPYKKVYNHDYSPKQELLKRAKNKSPRITAKSKVPVRMPKLLRVLLKDYEDSPYPSTSLFPEDYNYPTQPVDYEFAPPPIFSLAPSPPVSGTFNFEGTEIGDAAYIIPDELRGLIDLPPPSRPRTEHGLTVNDGQVNRHETRKDNGEFVSSFSTVDGTSRSEVGVLVPNEDGDSVLVVRGSYFFTTPEGIQYRVDYIADHNGYRATHEPVELLPFQT